MIIYKCDRCGTVIESEYDVMHVSIDNPEREQDKTGRVYARQIKRDLCVDCAAEIIDALEGITNGKEKV